MDHGVWWWESGHIEHDGMHSMFIGSMEGHKLPGIGAYSPSKS